MKRWLFLSLVAGWSCLGVASSQAAVFERDLVPGSGDGLLTFDDVSGREWLDLPESRLSDFPDGVLLELEPGGQFEDFTWATPPDVMELIDSAGIDTTTTDFEINQLAVQGFLDLLGPTIPLFADGSESTRGITDRSGQPNVDHIFLISRLPRPPFAGVFTRSDFGANDNPALFVGLFLYRESIPEPSTLGLCGSLFLLASCRRPARAVTLRSEITI